jgi:hypothetical protein
MASDVWQKLSLKERKYLRHRFGLHKPPSLRTDTEEQINSALREMSLAKRRNVVAGLPRRFKSALEEAARLLALDGCVVSGRK